MRRAARKPGTRTPSALPRSVADLSSRRGDARGPDPPRRRASGPPYLRRARGSSAASAAGSLSAEQLTVVVDVATVDVEAAQAWVRAVRAAHAAAAVVLIANKWGLARKEAEEADLVSRAARLARALDVDAWFPGLGEVDAEKATDADLAPLRYLLDDMLMRRRVFAANVARARKESAQGLRGAGRAGMGA